MKSIGIYYGGYIHPVHETWFRSLGDLQSFEIDRDPSYLNVINYARNAFRIEPDYDIVLCEAGVAARTGVARKLTSSDTKVIRLVAAEGPYKQYQEDKLIAEEDLTHKFVDGVIAVSEFNKKYSKELYDLSVRKVNPHIPNIDDFLDLEAVDSEKKELIFVGSNKEAKNVDALVEAVRGLDVHLHLVGANHSNHDPDNITTHGYLEDFKPLLERCDLFVLPSKYDGFGVAAAEAMASGTPSLVTETSGVKEYIDMEELICEPEASSLRAAIKEYYSLSMSKRKEIARNSRSAVKNLTRENQVNNFRQAVKNIVEEE